MQIKNRRRKISRFNVVSNVVLGVLVLSVGALCLSPTDREVTAVSGEETLYRSAGEQGVGISLTFNVYQGTEEVYRILDTLKAHGATATFFIGGCWADDNAECLKAIHAAGQEIGNHGYFHKSHDNLSVEQNKQEITSCNRFIELAIGVTPTLFAPPSGAYGKEMLSACKELDMKTILWSKDTVDWRDKKEELIYSRATKGVKKGDFILLHPMKETANILPKILQYYEENQLQVVSVSKNLEMRDKL